MNDCTETRAAIEANAQAIAELEHAFSTNTANLPLAPLDRLISDNQNLMVSGSPAEIRAALVRQSRLAEACAEHFLSRAVAQQGASASAKLAGVSNNSQRTLTAMLSALHVLNEAEKPRLEALVSDRRYGATDDRRNGASLKR